MSMNFLDYYVHGGLVTERWAEAKYNYKEGLDYDFHEPFTDAFNLMVVQH